MGTEPHIPEVYAPARPTCARELGPTGWLRALRDSKTRVEIGMVAVGPVSVGWTTRPRTSENRYETHYLFGAREAGIRVRLVDGVRAGRPGALAWLPPGPPYSIGLDTGPHRRVLHRLRFRILRDGTHLTPWKGARIVEGSTVALRLVEEFQNEMTVPGAHTEERFRALLLELSIEAFRCLEAARPNARLLSRAQAQRLVDHVAERLGEAVTPSDLARVVRLAPAYFARVFKRTFGMPPREWLVKERVRHGSRMLLDTDLNVGEIAYRLGYNEPRLFTRQFRATLGVTPRAYRRRR